MNPSCVTPVRCCSQAASDRGPWASLLALLVSLACTSCSLLIEVGGDQCVSGADCDGAGLDATCEQGVCVRRSDRASDCDGTSCDPDRDGGSELADAGSEAPIGGSCLGSMRCESGAICWKDQCVVERDVERFICEPEELPEVSTVSFMMPVRDFVTEEPLADLVVLACQATDVSCDDPVAQFEDTLHTGDVQLRLPYGFSGFLEVHSPEALTSLWYFTQPLVGDTEAKVLKAVAPETVQLLAAITGQTVDASKGIVILEAFDCARNAIGGIHFEESKRAGVPFFIIDGQPNLESTVSVRNELDNQAAGGFLNATPGFTFFTARIGIDGPVLGTFNANVRANTVTYLDIHP